MDVIYAESELMFAAHPAEVFAELCGCRVRQARHVSSLPAEAERPGDTHADNPVGQIGWIPDSLDSQFLGRDLLRRLAPEICRPKQGRTKGTDDVAADE